MKLQVCLVMAAGSQAKIPIENKSLKYNSAQEPGRALLALRTYKNYFSKLALGIRYIPGLAIGRELVTPRAAGGSPSDM
jgi:hypothetical protein